MHVRKALASLEKLLIGLKVSTKKLKTQNLAGAYSTASELVNKSRSFAYWFSKHYPNCDAKEFDSLMVALGEISNEVSKK